MSCYKYNTILSTVSALINWHKEKGVSYHALTCDSTWQMLNTIKAEQGPEGMPAGKTGMSKEVLRLLLGHHHNSSEAEPRMPLGRTQRPVTGGCSSQELVTSMLHKQRWTPLSMG